MATRAADEVSLEVVRFLRAAFGETAEIIQVTIGEDIVVVAVRVFDDVRWEDFLKTMLSNSTTRVYQEYMLREYAQTPQLLYIWMIEVTVIDGAIDNAIELLKTSVTTRVQLEMLESAEPVVPRTPTLIEKIKESRDKSQFKMPSTNGLDLGNLPQNGKVDPARSSPDSSITVVPASTALFRKLATTDSSGYARIKPVISRDE